MAQIVHQSEQNIVTLFKSAVNTGAILLIGVHQRRANALVVR